MIPEFCVFYGVLTFSWIEFLWEQYLTLRQVQYIYDTLSNIHNKYRLDVDIQSVSNMFDNCNNLCSFHFFVIFFLLLILIKD